VAEWKHDLTSAGPAGQHNPAGYLVTLLSRCCHAAVTLTA
jgi:hypothetical protein